MDNRIFPQTKAENGINYTLVGDYYLPNLLLPPEENYSLGKYGRMRSKFLKQHQKLLYINLLTSSKLNEYLHEIDEKANTRFEEIVSAMAKVDGTDENLKASNQMKWVGLMNNYLHCAEEIVFKELIYV